MAASAGVLYLNALRNPFVYDDYHTVVVNASIARLGDLRAIVLHDVTRPIVNFSYAVDRAVWGTAPFGFHLTSVLLHMLNAVLFWQVAWTLTRSSRMATAAASLFAVHPMMTEAVGYISGRSELLCATWMLAAFLAGRRWLDRGGRRWGGAMIGFWFAALASKETAAMFPFVFAAYIALRGDLAEARLPGGRAKAALVAGMIAFTVLAGLARIYVLAAIEYPGKVAVHWPFVPLDVNVAARYLLLLVRPSGQSIFHSVPLPAFFSVVNLMSVAAIAAPLVVAWRIRRTEPAAALGVVWFFAMLIPSAVLILLDQGEPMTEHRVYVASLGFFLAAGVGAGRAGAWLARRGEKPLAFGLLVFRLAVLALAAMTVMRNAVWADPITLYQESVDLAPAHYRPRLLLGEALLDRNRRDDAIEQFQTAIRLRPNDPTGYVKLALCYADTGKFAEARDLLTRARDLNPGDASIGRMLEALARVEARMKPVR
jgi:protein O-mannosyl-transferase